MVGGRDLGPPEITASAGQHPRRYMPVREGHVGLMPSQYNLPYTSHSRERVDSASAVKLLAPAILLWSLMSIPPRLAGEDGQGRSGSAKVDAKTGMRVRLGPWVRRPPLHLPSSLSPSLLLAWPPRVQPVTTRRGKVNGWMCENQFSDVFTLTFAGGDFIKWRRGEKMKMPQIIKDLSTFATN